MDAAPTHEPSRRTFDILRAAAIALLGGSAFAYLRLEGASLRRALAAAVAGTAALAALWAAERLSGRGAPPAPKAKKADFDWGMHYMRGFAIVCIMLTHFFGQTKAVAFSHAFLTSSTI